MSGKLTLFIVEEGRSTTEQEGEEEEEEEEKEEEEEQEGEGEEEELLKPSSSPFVSKEPIEVQEIDVVLSQLYCLYSAKMDMIKYHHVTAKQKKNWIPAVSELVLQLRALQLQLCCIFQLHGENRYADVFKLFLQLYRYLRHLASPQNPLTELRKVVSDQLSGVTFHGVRVMNLLSLPSSSSYHHTSASSSSAAATFTTTTTTAPPLPPLSPSPMPFSWSSISSFYYSASLSTSLRNSVSSVPSSSHSLLSSYSCFPSSSSSSSSSDLNLLLLPPPPPPLPTTTPAAYPLCVPSLRPGDTWHPDRIKLVYLLPYPPHGWTIHPVPPDHHNNNRNTTGGTTSGTKNGSSTTHFKSNRNNGSSTTTTTSSSSSTSTVTNDSSRMDTTCTTELSNALEVEVRGLNGCPIGDWAAVNASELLRKCYFTSTQTTHNTNTGYYHTTNSAGTAGGTPQDYSTSGQKSRFLTDSEFPSVEIDESENWLKIFSDMNGRIPLYCVAMCGLHKQALTLHYSTHHFLMSDPNSVLPNTWRHLLAAMAAARHKCEYLVRLEQMLFIAHGGDARWLIDHDALPAKLKKIASCNVILAHSPWRLSAADLKELMTGGSPWTVTEICQTILIMTHYHALSSLVWGLGIRCTDIDDLYLTVPPMVDYDINCHNSFSASGASVPSSSSSPFSCGLSSSPRRPSPSCGSSVDDEGGVFRCLYAIQCRLEANWVRDDYPDETVLPACFEEAWGEYEKDDGTQIPPVLRRMVSILKMFPKDGDSSQSPEKLVFSRKQKIDEASLRSVMEARPRVNGSSCRRWRRFSRRFGLCAATRVSLAVMERGERNEGRAMSGTLPIGEDVVYEDFNVKTEGDKMLAAPIDCYGLDDISFMILDSYYPNVSDRMAEEIKFLKTITNYRVGGIAVPTTKPLRDAVWHYVHRLYGVELHDYDYCAMNNFMALTQKVFVKKLVCYPERITRNDFRRLLKIFNVNDIIHYTCIACQSRRMVALTYALHALSSAMSTSR